MIIQIVTLNLATFYSLVDEHVTSRNELTVMLKARKLFSRLKNIPEDSWSEPVTSSCEITTFLESQAPAMDSC